MIMDAGSTVHRVQTT